MNGGVAFDVPQQRGDVLAHVVIARAVPEVLGALVVVLERRAAISDQLLAGRASCAQPKWVRSINFGTTTYMCK